MRTIITTIFIMALCTQVSISQELAQGTITVYGSATTTVMPDQVIWQLHLLARDEELEKVGAKIDKTLSEIMKAVDLLKIPDENIALGKIQVSIQHKTKNDYQTVKINYYEQRQKINLTQTNMGQYDVFRHTLTKIDGLTFRQHFTMSKLDSVIALTRVKALKNAKEKADQLASVLGQSVGRAISISEFKPNPTQRDLEDALSYQQGVVSSRGKPEGIDVKYRIYGVFVLE